MRLGEALALTEQDVDPKNKVVMVWVSKGDLPRTIPLTSRALLHVQGIPWRGLAKDIIEHRFRSVRAAAGLGDDVVIHTLRHTCGTRLVKAGVSLAAVQRWMGHKVIETTLRYSHLNTDDLHGGRNALEQVYQNSTNFCRT
jgi:integrase